MGGYRGVDRSRAGGEQNRPWGCRPNRSPDAILYLLAQSLLDLASDHLMREGDLPLRGRGQRRMDGRKWWTTIARPTRSPPPSFAPRGSRGWRICPSRVGAPSTAGWSAAGNTSSGRRPARTPPICARRASTDHPLGAALPLTLIALLVPRSPRTPGPSLDHPLAES